MAHDEKSEEAAEKREERRKFVNLLLGGALGAYLLPFPYVIYNYVQGPPARSAPAAPLALGTAESVFAGRDFAVVRLGRKTVTLLQTPAGVRALNVRCTHAGCAVEWNPDDRHFHCHCHGGQFDEYGAASKAPPTEALEMLTVEEQDGGLILKDIPSHNPDANRPA